MSRKACSTLVATLVASWLVAPVSLAQSWFQPYLGGDANTTLAHCTQQIGGRCALVCPATNGTAANVEGTDVYSNYSSICAAAVHAGVLKSGQPGSVVIVIGPGEKSYRGSERNGVTSRNYGPRATSFTFAKDGVPGVINWQTSWSRVPVEFSGPMTLNCPSGGTTNVKVWGTDVYTVDSSICGAAVHAGVITVNGGDVTVRRSGGLAAYPASLRSGVSSRSALSNVDAFTVSAATSVAQTPKGTATSTTTPTLVNQPVAAPSQPVGSAGGAGEEGRVVLEDPRQVTLGEVVPASQVVTPRTIMLTGWTVSGTAIPVTPRTIRLAGFTASGTAIQITPRTITLSGWTAAGLATQGVTP